MSHPTHKIYLNGEVASHEIANASEMFRELLDVISVYADGVDSAYCKCIEEFHSVLKTYDGELVLQHDEDVRRLAKIGRCLDTTIELLKEILEIDVED